MATIDRSLPGRSDMGIKKTDPRENGGRGPVVYSWRDGDRTFIGSPCIRL